MKHLLMILNNKTKSTCTVRVILTLIIMDAWLFEAWSCFIFVPEDSTKEYGNLVLSISRSGSFKIYHLFLKQFRLAKAHKLDKYNML